MPNQQHSDDPAADPQTNPPPKTPMAPSTPEKSEVREKGKTDSDNKEEVGKELAREFRWVEAAQIGSNVVLAIVGIIALCIYYGQLGEMRKSSKATQDAAGAAQSAAQTAHDTLVEIQKNSNDTHDLAVAAKAQADATKAIAGLNQRAFALNRPSVVIQGVPTKIDPAGGVEFRVAMINASAVTAIKFSGDCLLFWNGEALNGAKIPGRPITIGSGQTIYLCEGAISKQHAESGTLQIFARTTYEGPFGKYQYCIKEQYSNDVKAFFDLGECDPSKPFPQ